MTGKEAVIDCAATIEVDVDGKTIGLKFFFSVVDLMFLSIISLPDL